MHDVMIVTSRGTDDLTIGKRAIERFAGIVLAVPAAALLIGLWPNVVPLEPLR